MCAPRQVGFPGGMARRGPTVAEYTDRIGRRRATFQAGNDARGAIIELAFVVGHPKARTDRGPSSRSQ